MTVIFQKLIDPIFWESFTNILGKKGLQIDFFRFFETLIGKSSCNCNSCFPVTNPVLRKILVFKLWVKMLLTNHIEFYFFLHVTKHTKRLFAWFRSDKGHLDILRAIVLQIDGPTECIDNPTFRVDSPTKPILAVFSPTNRWSYSTVRLSIRWSRPVDRKSYCL